jgi:hypothetical protein
MEVIQFFFLPFSFLLQIKKSKQNVLMIIQKIIFNSSRKNSKTSSTKQSSLKASLNKTKYLFTLHFYELNSPRNPSKPPVTKPA